MSEIMFFLGAGASVPAGLKDVVAVVPDLISWLDNEKIDYPNGLECINEIIKILKDWYEAKKVDKSVDIETLLEIIEKLESSFYDVVPEYFNDRSLKLGNECIEVLRNRILSRAVKLFIHSKFQEFETFDYYRPLELFLANYGPLLIFTTNYDIIIEQFCYLHSPRLSYTDFFNGTEWGPEEIRLEKFDIILHKLHGSVSWARTESGEYVKLTQKSGNNKIVLMNGQKAVPLILYPGKKLEYIQPTIELLERLKRSLKETKCCIAVGYKFGDDHIAKLFRYSASKNDDLILFVVSPSAHSIYYKTLKRHRDEEFPHGIAHEGFSKKGFNTTIPSALEGRTICLPYKFQNIFPDLLDYYENLKGGLARQKILDRVVGKIEPLTVYGSADLIGCLNSFLNCEFFDRIDFIVQNRTDGWDSIIHEVAKVDFQRVKLEVVYDIFLKRYFNFFSSSKSKEARGLVVRYLTLTPDKIKTKVESYLVNLYFEESGVTIQGAFWFQLFLYLEQQFVKYKKIAEVDHEDVFKLIQKGKDFFQRWKNGMIPLANYLSMCENKSSEEFEFLEDLIVQQQEFVHSQDEAQLVNQGISHIVEQLEKNRLS